MTFNTLLYEIDENILTITINRPDSYNSLSTETKLELIKAFKKGNEDRMVKTIVITGAGDKAFCSGQDLSESKDITEDSAKEWVKEFDDLYRVIRSIEKPIIASINGFSVGSGLQLALLADIRISNESAKYGMTEIDVGLPAIIGTTMFWEAMGKSRTIDLILTGRLLTAEEAERYGLITRLVSDNELKAETRKLAQELASKPPVALGSNKNWFKQVSNELFEKCMVFAMDAHTRAYEAGEPQEQMRKFFEVRSKN